MLNYLKIGNAFADKCIVLLQETVINSPELLLSASKPYTLNLQSQEMYCNPDLGLAEEIKVTYSTPRMA